MSGQVLDRRAFLGAATTAAAAAIAAPGGADAATGRSSGVDVVIVGAGVFGTWTAWKLRQAGAKVLLVDAWGPAHARGTSGGETRLIRTEYRGDPLYTRWAWESLADWKALSARHEMPLFHATGALYLYPHVDELIGRSAALHAQMGIPMERITPAELARRWPQIDTSGIAVGLLQPTMGPLMARRSVQVLRDDFVAAGGTYRQMAVAPPVVKGGRLEAITSIRGETVAADKFVFACGPWLPKLFPEVVGARIVPVHKDVFFFAPEAGDARFAPPNLPAWVDVSSPDLHYGFPDIEARGFKIALDRNGAVIDPDQGDRTVSPEAIAQVRAYLRRRFPDLADRQLVEQRVCQYENTHDGNFLIDRHPEADNLWIAGGGSGHGFKHGPAIGTYITALIDGAPPESRFLLASHREHDGRA
ncbi:FAD-dependent oxidoreductase [Novosphingobium resinovorum]|uniref:FAD-dependent oxidoreductase n=1 Tax=Novosphingobium resinovorum TaxID=158500 RepID=UPI002ED4893A|nr:FAD-dependent oxidoreductase [Novosphingobium resinovorum]